jgi:hypothetical protein
MEAWLEIVILKCPKCGNLIAEPAWFVELEQDITCGSCKATFPSSKNVIDRTLLRFEIVNGKIKAIYKS